jgi:hypothetical protein
MTHSVPGGSPDIGDFIVPDARSPGSACPGTARIAARPIRRGSSGREPPIRLRPPHSRRTWLRRGSRPVAAAKVAFNSGRRIGMLRRAAIAEPTTMHVAAVAAPASMSAWRGPKCSAIQPSDSAPSAPVAALVVLAAAHSPRKAARRDATSSGRSSARKCPQSIATPWTSDASCRQASSTS